MNPGLLYLNDYRTQLFDGDQQRLSEPALLFTGDKQLLSGRDALARARLEPAKVSSLHWQQLNQAPLTPARDGFRHHADLAYQQLTLWLQQAQHSGPVAVATSLPYDTNQQALLAGLLNANGTPMQALAPVALLQSAGYLQRTGLHPDAPFFHLEICQHNAVLTKLSCRDGQLVVLQQTPLPDQGATPLLNQWLNCLARECVRQSRYDPLHSADSEQRLFNQLLPSIKQIRAGNLDLDIDGNKIKLDPAWLTAIARPLNDRIAGQVSEGPLLLSPLAANIPDLPGTLLSDTDLPLGFSLLQPALAGAPLKAHQSISFRAPSTDATPLPATHLLAGDQAFALEGQLHLVRRDSLWYHNTNGTTPDLSLISKSAIIERLSNGWKSLPLRQNAFVRPGDRLIHPTLGELRFIRLEASPDGS
ncbi:hypothetical protein [Simiduia agarivorans]|uniref:Uncharacterized protein n=1 Tax=Simiduia agarivorans (strain DSM 21679 / JCM 13881 / BCRC 17597 / SA1) TaxID=1117647 RepID=K4KIW2_SIMAS|nr:hypothetical protein [Simiduia agarivorans]AFU98130.1 hypothetical protein M5M_04615 [Simiduia agarivorans SA1 = DSM 21679]